MEGYRKLPSYFLFAALLPAIASAGIKRIDTDRKVVALTFDDGPHPPYTDQLLDTLAKEHVPATFFLIGKQVERYPETVATIREAGHEIGGHSYDWDTFLFKGRQTVELKLDKMDAAFQSAGITNVLWFRPPGGLLMPGQQRLLEERGLRHISAGVIAGDWKDVDAQTICKRVVRRVRPGAIIVLHDGGGDRSSTVAAVPLLLKALREKGYSFLSISELLEAGL